jgi:hypothetical protein
VGPTRYRAQHGQALGCDPDTVFAKEAGCVDGRLHEFDRIMCPLLDSVKKVQTGRTPQVSVGTPIVQLLGASRVGRRRSGEGWYAERRSGS